MNLLIATIVSSFVFTANAAEKSTEIADLNLYDIFKGNQDKLNWHSIKPTYNVETSSYSDEDFETLGPCLVSVKPASRDGKWEIIVVTPQQNFTANNGDFLSASGPLALTADGDITINAKGFNETKTYGGKTLGMATLKRNKQGQIKEVIVDTHRTLPLLDLNLGSYVAYDRIQCKFIDRATD